MQNNKKKTPQVESQQNPNQNCNIKKNDSNCLSIVHWNCNSLNNKLIEFELFLNKYKPCIVSLNETKMNHERAKEKLKFEGYETFHRHRIGNMNGGGGVCILVKSNIISKQIDRLEASNLELIHLEIELNTASKLNFISHYNPPNNTVSEELFKTICNDGNFILCGDLNAKTRCIGNDQQNRNGLILEDIMLSNNVVVLNNKNKTYNGFGGNKNSTLDLCLSSPEIMQKIVKFEVLEADMNSDHLPFQAIIKLKCEEKNRADQSTHGKIPVLNFKKANWEKFTEILSSCNNYENENDVEAMNDFITKALLKAAKESIPTYVTKTKKNRRLVNYFSKMTLRKH